MPTVTAMWIVGKLMSPDEKVGWTACDAAAELCALIRSSTVLSRTFAPFAQSSQLVSSFGEWLMPPTLGTKIMPIGHELRHLLRVVAGAARQPHGVQAERAGSRAPIARLHLRSSPAPAGCVLASVKLDGRAGRRRDLRAARLDARRPARAASARTDRGARSLIAHVPGNHVRRVRLDLDAADGADLPALAARVTISRTASVSCDAATSASCRSSIGVVPA